MAAITLPWPIQRQLECATAKVFAPEPGLAIDFTRPAGEPALVGSDSVSWRVFKNPVTLFIGGVAAVSLELAEPRIRTAIRDHSGYRRDPLRRLRRTGLAAMITVYGARSQAESLIAGVSRLHSRIAGTTDAGVPYSAADPELVTWVHVTAAFGFAQAYHRFARPLSAADIDRYFLEATAAARLYGSPEPPVSAAAVDALIARTTPRLRASSAIREFLDCIGEAPAFPRTLLWLQRLLVRAARELIPGQVRDHLCLGGSDLSIAERWVVSRAASLADRIVIAGSPAVLASRRVGLPPAHLYR